MNMQNEIPTMKTPTPPIACCPGFVLVVDDEEQNRDLLRDPLEAQGHEVAEAQSGAEALQKISERQPDVVLLDVMMPKLDGFEVCRRLKRDLKTAPIQILMVTALSERKERLMGIEAGANDFLTKPIDVREVTLRVANAVYTKQLFTRLENALVEVHQLHGLLPICCYCKRIRDDQNYWHRLETYISGHSGVRFTHRICPDCTEKLKADLQNT